MLCVFSDLTSDWLLDSIVDQGLVHLHGLQQEISINTPRSSLHDEQNKRLAVNTKLHSLGTVREVLQAATSQTYQLNQHQLFDGVMKNEQSFNAIYTSNVYDVMPSANIQGLVFGTDIQGIQCGANIQGIKSGTNIQGIQCGANIQGKHIQSGPDIQGKNIQSGLDMQYKSIQSGPDMQYKSIQSGLDIQGKSIQSGLDIPGKSITLVTTEPQGACYSTIVSGLHVQCVGKNIEVETETEPFFSRQNSATCNMKKPYSPLSPVVNGETGQMMSRETGQLMSRETGQLMSRETGQLVSGETGQLMSGEIDQLISGETAQKMSRETCHLTNGETSQLMNGETIQLMNGETGQLINGETSQLINREIGLINEQTHQGMSRMNKPFNSETSQATNGEVGNFMSRGKVAFMGEDELINGEIGGPTVQPVVIEAGSGSMVHLSGSPSLASSADDINIDLLMGNSTMMSEGCGLMSADVEEAFIPKDVHGNTICEEVPTNKRPQTRVTGDSESDSENYDSYYVQEVHNDGQEVTICDGRPSCHLELADRQLKHISTDGDDDKITCDGHPSSHLEMADRQLKHISDDGDDDEIICDALSSSDLEMAERELKHISDDGEYICHLCGGVYQCQATLDDHHIEHSGQRFSCPVCGRCCSSGSNLTRHITRVHTHDKPYKCQICDKTFSSSSVLSKHRQIHPQEGATFTFKCYICDEGFPTADGLRQHGLIHTSHKLYKCKLCDLAFKTSQSLVKHKIFHVKEKMCTAPRKKTTGVVKRTKEPGQKIHKCQLCTKAYVHEKHLNNHIDKIHPFIK